MTPGKVAGYKQRFVSVRRRTRVRSPGKIFQKAGMKRRRRGGAIRFHKVFVLVRHRANLPDAAPGMGRGALAPRFRNFVSTAPESLARRRRTKRRRRDLANGPGHSPTREMTQKNDASELEQSSTKNFVPIFPNQKFLSSSSDYHRAIFLSLILSEAVVLRGVFIKVAALPWRSCGLVVAVSRDQKISSGTIRPGSFNGLASGAGGGLPAVAARKLRMASVIVASSCRASSPLEKRKVFISTTAFRNWASVMRCE